MRSLCENEVAASCLAVKSPQACIDDLTEQKLAESAAAAAPSGPWAPHPAAVAVPAVCACTLQCRAPFGAVATAHIAALDSFFATRLQSCAVVLVVLLACLP
jgi:hypothetical protein